MDIFALFALSVIIIGGLGLLAKLSFMVSLLVFLTIALPIAAGKFLKWDMLGAIILGLSLYAVYRLPFLAAFVPILDAYFTYKVINNIKSTPSAKEIVTYIPIAIIWAFTLLWLFGVVLSINDALITYYPIVHAILVLSLYGAYTIGEPMVQQANSLSRLSDFTKISTKQDGGMLRIVPKEEKTPLGLYLDNVVVGQEHAKKEIEEEIVKLLRKQQALRTRTPILGTFFFVGPTGVGKTETAKAIADYFASMGYQFLRFDMGNFSDYHTASTLVGSPKGYIGSEEGGALTRPLMRNPRAVILFDEMEKAHSSLYKTFMSLIDEGEIQEVSTGARVRTDNTIIIFTSNLYQKTIGEIYKLVPDDIKREALIRDVLTGNLSEVAKYVPSVIEEKPSVIDTRGSITDRFPPEFIGRIDKVIPFTRLHYYDYVEIVDRLAKKYNVSVDARAVADKYMPIAESYGVRQFIKKVEGELLLS